jgi:hypothetical protein
MNPDRDITILAVGGSGERLAALAAGTVDATPLDVAYIDRTDSWDSIRFCSLETW